MTVLIPLDIESILNCIHDWFEASTGLQVVWADQSAPRPEYPYGTLKIISGPTPITNTWEERATTDLLRPAGQEIELEMNAGCQFTISAQAFVDGEDASNPVADARSYMLSALAALNLPMYLEAFEEVNVSVSRSEAVRDLTALVGTARQSRAAMDVIFNSVLTAEEFVGYIEKVHATSPGLGVDRTFGVGEEI